MLVLNRRPGETIVIEPDLRVTVLSVTDRRVWIGLRSSAFPELRVSASVVSPGEARLEIVPMSSVIFDGDRVRIVAGADGDLATTARAGIAVDRKPGERVEIGDDLWVALAAISKGNPSVTFGGSSIGEPFSITLIRPAGSYVRLGVDAPDRRVYREELWDVVQASGGTRLNGDDGAAPSAKAGEDLGATTLEASSTAHPAGAAPEVPITMSADVTAGSAAG